VIGPQSSKDTFRVRDFLSRNRILFTWIDTENGTTADELLHRFNANEKDLPIVAYGDEWILRNPANVEIAEKTGLKKVFKDIVYDLAIVARVGRILQPLRASEGLETVVLEAVASGGQAGTSSKIENYLVSYRHFRF
jgi:thioredoxin reductase (NADPH)